ncbi:hypothetical protein [Motiliproteus sp. SC1-56]|uniref:hypothetical protein n=1 Tax=Motiliproteus sp. SC1-56 TaxID=2799565 RepID=UPI001A8C01B6|nr:hypothetical protein [Motiliproteus sp. SC1-56]
MSNTWIVAAEKIVNGEGFLDGCLAIEQRLKTQGVAVETLTIDPLKTDWHSPLAANHFRSGCAPVEALARARQLIVGGDVEAVVISGHEPLASGYSREERLERMAIYGPDCPLTQAYNDLAECFIKRQGGDRDLFIRCRDALYQNYLRTYRKAGHPVHRLPAARWLEPVTPLFRGVDCANPVVDFEGRVLLCNDRVLKALKPAALPLLLKGVGLGLLAEDGPGAMEAICDYRHLQQAFDECVAQAGVDVAAAVKDERLLLEVYSCYPVVPMAFLLSTGIASNLTCLPELLEKLPVTVTGGMNLARAPWNNPALNGLVDLCAEIRAQGKHGGVLHANGGLGYRQGVALLSCAS